MNTMAKDCKIVDNVLIINEGRTKIESHEFFDQKFVKAIIPEGVTEIGYWAFGGCKKLKEVVLPASLECVADQAFALCPLEEIVFTDDCPHLKEVHKSSFANSPWEKRQHKEREFLILGSRLFLHGEGPSKAVIPDGVEIIGDGSCCDCEIEEVIIPEGVKTIENGAFAVCEKLSAVHLPTTLETIGDNAFSGCKSLKEIILPEKLKSIGAFAFENCTSLETVVFPEKLKSIDERPFFCLSDEPGKLQHVETLIPAMLNGCKLKTNTSLWFLENLWKDENSIREIAVLYLTQSGTKVLAQAESVLLLDLEQTIAIMSEFKSNYKLKPATIKKIDAFMDKHA